METELIVAVGSAGLLVTLAFRQLINTLLKLNDELQEAIAERRKGEVERDALRTRIAELETQVGSLEARLTQQSLEVQELRTRLSDCDEIVTALRAKHPIQMQEV